MENKNISRAAKPAALESILIILVALLFIGGGYWLNRSAASQEESMPVYPAKVVAVTQRQVETFSFADDREVTNIRVYFQAEITRGDERGRVVPAEQFIDGMMAVNPEEVKTSSRIIISPFTDGGSQDPEWFFVEYNRSPALAGLLFFFLLMLVLLGRHKGIRTILALAFTFSAIFLVFVPAILQGRNIYLTSMVVSIFIIVMSLLLLNGLTRKSVCAILGNLGGLALAGLLALLMNRLTRLSGLVGDETMYLLHLDDLPDLDLVAIIWSGMVIGALGAIMDVAMSITSAIQEIAVHRQKPGYAQLLRSGLIVGADVLGTMTNTLILAYTGSSLALVLVLITYRPGFLLLFSSEMIAVELIQALVGSLGILAAIPVTSLAAAYFFSHPDKPSRKEIKRKLQDRFRQRHL